MNDFKDFIDKICDNCKPYFEMLLRRIEELEKRLLAYENAHTPPSRQRFPKRETHAPKKNGRPEGYAGSTRAIPKPDTTIELTASKCPYCKSHRISEIKVERRVIEDVPEPVQKKVTEFLVYSYRCNECKREFETRHKDLPDNGRFGNNALAQVSLMKYEDRLPLRKIEEALKRQYDIEITHSSILDFTNRVSSKVRQEYDAIAARIRQSDVVYVDETGIKVGGKRYWIWIFVTATDTIAAIRNSRGGKVVEDILGKNYKGVIVCDGWSVYPQFTDNLQRCWAHLLREARFLSGNAEEAEALSKRLHELYKTLIGWLDGAPDHLRLMIRIAAEEIMKEIIRKKYRSEEVRKFIAKINNGFDHWFTFVVNPLVEPTNNRAERALREHVVQRKIIGTLRNEKGTFNHETMMSVLATWKQHEYNTYEKLIEAIRS